MSANIEKLQELVKDEAFLKELFTKEEPEDVQALFEAKGVELSLDEVKSIGETLEKVANGEITAEQLEKSANGELSEDDLAEVAGGELATLTACAIIFAGGVIVGGGIGAGTAAVVENFNSIKRFFRRW